MAGQVWGTGYGSKRHLVAEGTRKDEPTSKWGRQRLAESACSSVIFLSFFSDEEVNVSSVMKKPACGQCAKKADIKACVRCHGTGQEPS